MVAGDAPEWLPEGWTMEMRRRKDGKTDRYYMSPVLGRTFRTKREVLQHLKNEMVGELAPQSPVHAKYLNDVVPQSSACSDDSFHLKQNKSHVQGCSEKSQSPLPDGWIVEVKIRKSGKKAGDKYKCYYDPSTGARCYSMQEVFRHMNGGQMCNPTSRDKTSSTPKDKTSSAFKEKTNTNSGSADNVLMHSECSSDGLPAGWMKVTKCRKNSSGTRKDPYYIDPVSGYVFRSKKDVFRYVETGEISKHAFKRDRESIAAWLSTTETPSSSVTKMQDNPGSAVKRCLLVTPIACYRAPQDTAEPSGDKGSSPKVVTMPNINNIKENKLQITGVDEVGKYQQFLSSVPLEMSNKVRLDQNAEKHLNSTSDASPLLSNEKSMVPVDTNILNLNNDSSNHVSLKDSKQSTVKCLKKVAVRRSSRYKGSNEKILQDVDEPLKAVEQVGTNPSVKHVLGLTSRISASRIPFGLADEKKSEAELDLCELDKMVLKIANDILGGNATTIPAKNGQSPMVVNPTIVPGGERTNFPDEDGQLPMDMNPTYEHAGIPCKSKNNDLTEPVNEKSSTAANRADHKAKNKVALPLQRRSSRRLAGVGAEPAEMNGDRTAKMVMPFTVIRSSLSSADSASAEQLVLSSSNNFKPVVVPAMISSKETEDDITDRSYKSEPAPVRTAISLKEPEGKEPINQNQAPEVEHPALENDSKVPESTLMFPFGDAWPDPCLEFAFKTLTGDLPIFEDTASIENFFHQQLTSVRDCSSTSASSLALGVSDEFSQHETPIAVGKFNSSAGKVSLESKLKNGLQTTERLTRSSKRAKVN